MTSYGDNVSTKIFIKTNDQFQKPKQNYHTQQNKPTVKINITKNSYSDRY